MAMFVGRSRSFAPISRPERLKAIREAYGVKGTSHNTEVVKAIRHYHPVREAADYEAGR